MDVGALARPPILTNRRAGNRHRAMFARRIAPASAHPPQTFLSCPLAFDLFAWEPEHAAQP